tara:strand:+ start:1656 stop:4925 length:3270 start_codon:yes stop_codon:yes gene_type:complete
MSEAIDFDALWSMSDAQFDQNISQSPDGIGDQVGAGVDLGQALLYRGGQSVAEAFGFADSAFGQAMVDGKNENMEEVNKVQAHPLYKDDEFSFRGLLDQVARGVGTVGVALPALAAAPLAPIVGASGSTGALVAGGLTSAFMNVGDIGLKAEEMDDAYTASMADIGTGFALGALEPLAAAKFVKALGPAFRATSPEVLANIKAGNAAAFSSAIRSQVSQGPSMARLAGTAALGSGFTEGVQDFSTTLAATNSTDYWDKFDVEESLKESAMEALVGGILGLPFGVGSSIVTKGQNSADMNFAKQVDEGIIEYDAPTQSWSKNQEKIPVTETRLGHLYSKFVAPIVGDVPSKMVGKLRTNKSREFAAKFTQTTGDYGRRIGVRPVHAESMMFKADYLKGLKSFMGLSSLEANAVHDQRVMPSSTVEEKAAKAEAYAALSSEAKEGSNALATFLDGTIKNDLKKVGIDTTLFEGGSYFPLMGRLDYKKIKEDRSGFINGAMEVAKAKGIKNLTRDKVEAYVQRIEQQGYEHFGSQADVKTMEQFELSLEALNQKRDKAVLKESKKIIKKQKLTTADQKAEAVKKAEQIVDKREASVKTKGAAKVNKQNAVETHRMLAELPQDFWNSWIDPKTSVQESIYSYYEMMSERLGHAKRFGVDNELFYKEAAEVIRDAKAQGVQFDEAAMIRDMANMMNLSQRIPIRNLDVSQGSGVRTAQNAVRAGLSVTLLPLSILPSLAEVFVVASRTGQTGKSVSMAGKLTARIIREQFKHGRGLAFKDASQLVDEGIIEDLGITAYELKNTAAARIGDNEIGGKITNIENFFYNMTLTPQFTESLRMTAAILGEKSFRSDLVKYQAAVNEGNLSEQVRIGDKFAEAGLNITEAYNWHLKGAKKDKYYNEQFKMGVLNIVEDTVMRPRMVQKPAWMSDERFKLIGQLKSFSIVFTNVVMKGWYNQMIANGTPEDKIRQAAKIAPYIGMMIVTQIMASALREFVKTGDIEKWSDKTAISHALGAITYIGGIGFALDPLRASNWGVDPTSVLLGPAASKANDLLAGVNAIIAGSLAPEDVVGAVLKDITKGMPASGIISDLIGSI